MEVGRMDTRNADLMGVISSLKISGMATFDPSIDGWVIKSPNAAAPRPPRPAAALFSSSPFSSPGPSFGLDASGRGGRSLPMAMSALSPSSPLYQVPIPSPTRGRTGMEGDGRTLQVLQEQVVSSHILMAQALNAAFKCIANAQIRAEVIAAARSVELQGLEHQMCAALGVLVRGSHRSPPRDRSLAAAELLNTRLQAALESVVQEKLAADKEMEERDKIAAEMSRMIAKANVGMRERDEAREGLGERCRELEASVRDLKDELARQYAANVELLKSANAASASNRHAYQGLNGGGGGGEGGDGWRSGAGKPSPGRRKQPAGGRSAILEAQNMAKEMISQRRLDRLERDSGEVLRGIDRSESTPRWSDAPPRRGAPAREESHQAPGSHQAPLREESHQAPLREEHQYAFEQSVNNYQRAPSPIQHLYAHFRQIEMDEDDAL